MQSFQAILYYGTWPSATIITLMLAFTLLVLVVAYTVFAGQRARLPEAI